MLPSEKVSSSIHPLKGLWQRESSLKTPADGPSVPPIACFLSTSPVFSVTVAGFEIFAISVTFKRVVHCLCLLFSAFPYKRTSLKKKKKNGNKQLFTLMERRHCGVCIAWWEGLTGMGRAYSACQFFHLDLQNSLLGSGNAAINNLGFLPKGWGPKEMRLPLTHRAWAHHLCDTLFKADHFIWILQGRVHF